MILPVILSLLLLCCFHAQAISAQEERCICLEEVSGARGLRFATFLASARDGSGRLFYGEPRGVTWIIDRNGTLLPEPFLNITNITFAPGNADIGLLDMVFHPQLVANRKLYIVYSTRLPDGNILNMLSELRVSESNPNVVDPTSERRLLSVLLTNGMHSGGSILFGDDGYLYMFTGDGGPQGDPDDNVQDLSTVLGKCLRINVDVGTGDGQYGIPPDNPFVGVPGAREEIYTYGLRQPWGVDIDPGDPTTGAGRGRIFIGDVGQDAWEEVDMLTPSDIGRNFGWAAYEANACYKPELCTTLNPDDLVFPIHAYNHTVTGSCVIGGNVYRGLRSPGLNGLYFFAEYSTRKLFYLEEDVSGAWTAHQFGSCSGEYNCTTTCDRCADGLSNFYNTHNVHRFAIDDSNEIYFVSSNSSIAAEPGGAVYRLVEATL